jgi:hypothetical protein
MTETPTWKLAATWFFDQFIWPVIQFLDPHQDGKDAGQPAEQAPADPEPPRG